MKKISPKGFTLIELLVVISVISTLSSIILASVHVATIKGRDAGRISQIHQVQNALDLYYSTYGQYPANISSFCAPAPLCQSPEIPRNWATMLTELTNKKVINVTTWIAYNQAQDSRTFSLIPIAHAALSQVYYGASIQDPLYVVANNYDYSYGYIASADQKSYIIRIYLEDINNQLFNSSQEGPFIGVQPNGSITECSKALHYYCTTSPK